MQHKCRFRFKKVLSVLLKTLGNLTWKMESHSENFEGKTNRYASAFFCLKWNVFLVGAFSLKEKRPTLTVSSFFVFFSVDNLTLSGPLFLQFVHLSYLFIFHICSSLTKPESVGSILALNHKCFNASKSTGETKGSPFGFFRHYATFFRKLSNFIKGYPLHFLKFSVCRKRWMSLNDLFSGCSALCDFFTKYVFWKKNFPNISNSCSLNTTEPNIWRRLGTFPSCYSSLRFNTTSLSLHTEPYAEITIKIGVDKKEKTSKKIGTILNYLKTHFGTKKTKKFDQMSNRNKFVHNQ